MPSLPQRETPRINSDFPHRSSEASDLFDLSWDTINAIATCSALLPHAYIVEVDSNKRYVRDYRVGSLNELSTDRDKILELQQAVAKGWTIKVENVEHFNQSLLTKASQFPSARASFHLYIGQKGGASFGMHTDPDPVLVVCLQGRKTFHLKGYEPFTMVKGDWVFIPANHPHEALSDDKSAIMSVGFHEWGEKTPSYFLPDL